MTETIKRAALLIAMVAFSATAWALPMRLGDLAFLSIFGAPTVTITSPAAPYVLADESEYTATGTATNATLIEWSVDGSTWTACTGTTSWSCTVTPAAGAHTLTIRANGSTTATRSIIAPSFLVAYGKVRGAAALSDTLVIDGNTLTADVSCDFTTTSPNSGVTCSTGGAFPIASTGTSLDVVRAPAPGEGAVRFNGGTVLQTASTSLGDVTTEDLVFEITWKRVNESSTLVSRRPGGSGAGWDIVNNSGGSTALRLSDGTNLTTVNLHDSPVANALYHSICYVDRSVNSTAGGTCRTNGVNVASGANPFALGSLTRSTTLTFGSATGFTSKATGSIHTFKTWKCASCLTGSTWMAVAGKRSAAYWGALPQLAAGQDEPSTMTTSARYCPITDAAGVTQLFYLGANAPCVGNMRDVNGAVHRGYLSEPATTNLMLQSDDLGLWMLQQVTVTANQAVAATGSTTLDAIVPDTTNTVHGVYRAINYTSGTTYTASVFVRPGSQKWAAVGWGSGNGIDNAIAFNLETGAVGTRWNTTANITGRIQGYGGGLYRIEVTGAATLTAAGNAAVYCADQDGEAVGNTDAWKFVGDALTPCAFAGGFQVEAQPTATSYVATTTASVARSSNDRLVYSPTSNYSSTAGTIEVAYVIANHDATGNPLVQVNDGTTANRNYVYVGGPGDVAAEITTTAGAAQTGIAGAVDLADGLAHTLRKRYAANDVELYVDGASIGTDTTATLPTSVTGIYIGREPLDAFSVFGLIERVAIYTSVQAPNAPLPSLVVTGVSP